MHRFYKGKKVFITGHSGFKGSWLCKILASLGAEIYGFSLRPNEQSLFNIAKIDEISNSFWGDIRDFDLLKSAFSKASPDIVFHLAAQPIVLEGYNNPRYTYETNAIGTVNLLECVRFSDSVKSVVNITTDKVYENHECDAGYTENDTLNGFDPYSNSKSCSELITSCYKNSFLQEKKIAVSTARAGNVIGGGDFAKYRIIPDCINAAINHEKIIVRNPFSVRPYQHVLEPLMVYLMLAQKQYENIALSGSYNIGPDECDCIETRKLVELFIKYWRDGLQWVDKSNNGPHEANFLKLDCTKLKNTFGWKPRWNIDKAMEKIVDWTKCYYSGADIRVCMDKQIQEFLTEAK